MSENMITAEWDWKASPQEIAEALNSALEGMGSDLEFLPTRDNDGDNTQLMLARPRRP